MRERPRRGPSIQTHTCVPVPVSEAKAGSEQARLQKEDGSTRRSTEWAVWVSFRTKLKLVTSISNKAEGDKMMR